jgi:hypothetical protein
VNKYVVRLSTSVSYGTCEDKEIYGTFSMSLYVNNILTTNPLDVQSITGLTGNPFNSIQDAIIRGYELSALYKYSEITIVLKTGDHAMVRDGSGTYMPWRYDDWSQNTKFIIKSEDDALPVTIRYKLRDHFKFFVGAGMHVYNVVFDASDSIMTPNSATKKAKLLDKTTTYCADAAGNPIYNSGDCAFITTP